MGQQIWFSEFYVRTEGKEAMIKDLWRVQVVMKGLGDSNRTSLMVVDIQRVGMTFRGLIIRTDSKMMRG